MRQHDGLVQLTCGSGRMLVDLNSGRGEVTLPRSLMAIEDATRLFIEGAMWTWLIGTGRVRAVHAGMVGDGRRSALLRGASGAGKSTITYACMRAGMLIASDDWVYSATTRSSTELHGYPWRLFLVADAATRFDELRGRELVAHPGSDRWKLPVTPSPEQQLLSGIYSFGSGPADKLEVKVTRGNLTVSRIKGAPRNLFHLGSHAFYPAGADAVRVRFTVADGKAKLLTVHDPGLLVTAERQP